MHLKKKNEKKNERITDLLNGFDWICIELSDELWRMAASFLEGNERPFEVHTQQRRSRRRTVATRQQGKDLKFIEITSS